MSVVPLEAAHLFDLNLAILGWDGYLPLYSSKSSIRGTHLVPDAVGIIIIKVDDLNSESGLKGNLF
jgi:hypothetical protein